MLPLTLFIAYLSGDFYINVNEFGVVLVISLLSIFSNVFNFYSIDKLNIVVQDMIKKTYIIVTVLILQTTGVENINTYHILGAIAIIIGLYMGIELKNTKIEKINKKGFIIAIISVILSSLSSVSVKYAINSSIASASGTMIIKATGFIFLSIVLLIKTKPKVSEHKENTKEVFIISMSSPLVMFFYSQRVSINKRDSGR